MFQVWSRSVAAGECPRETVLYIHEPFAKIPRQQVHGGSEQVLIHMDAQDAQDNQDMTLLHAKLARAMIRNRSAPAHDKI